MKIYIEFSVNGEITEIKTNNAEFKQSDYNDYKFIEKIKYDKYNFILLYNKNNQDKKNLTSLPFYKNEIFGAFILFIIDGENIIKNLTENKFIKILGTFKKFPQDYSSDDFNLSDD
jgi:hypothetical protein